MGWRHKKPRRIPFGQGSPTHILIPTRSALAGLMLTFLSATTSSEPVLPEYAPLPYYRPAIISNPGIDASLKTASVAAVAGIMLVPESKFTSSGSVTVLKSGLDATGSSASPSRKHGTICSG